MEMTFFILSSLPKVPTYLFGFAGSLSLVLEMLRAGYYDRL